MKKRQFSSEKGQTLILTVIILVILLFAAIFLFDYQSIIRGKIKSQTTADAAAITGANWQMHTLNLIGELNLVKACDVLITDFSTHKDNIDNYDAKSFLEIETAEVKVTNKNANWEVLGELNKTVFLDHSKRWKNIPGLIFDSKKEFTQFSHGAAGDGLLEFTVETEGIVYMLYPRKSDGEIPDPIIYLDKNGKKVDLVLGLIRNGWMEIGRMLDEQNVLKDSKGKATGNAYQWIIMSRWCRQGDVFYIDLSNSISPILIKSSLEENPKNDIDYLEEAVLVVTEMQQRIAFIGPLIGYGATQQAAKNNGIANKNQGYQDLMEAHIYALENDFYTTEDAEYAEMKETYIAMLKNFRELGQAVFTYPDNIQNPQFESSPYIGYLTSKSIYDAINADDWCPLRFLLKEMHGVPADNQWWGSPTIIESSIQFPDESEYLSVDIKFSYDGGTYNMVDELGLFDDPNKGLFYQDDRTHNTNNKWNVNHTNSKDPYIGTQSDYYVGNTERIGDYGKLLNPNHEYDWNSIDRNRNDYPYDYDYDIFDENNVYNEYYLSVYYSDANNKPVYIKDPTLNKYDQYGFPAPKLNPYYDSNPDLAPDLKYAPLPRIIWVKYDNSTWYSYGDVKTENWNEYFLGNGEIKSEMASRGTGTQIQVDIEEFPLFFTKNIGKKDDHEIGDEIFFKDQKIEDYANTTYGEKLETAEKHLKNSDIHINSSALAKPVGWLDTVDDGLQQAHLSQMVLPVFKTSTIIPVYLENQWDGTFDVGWYLFQKEYLPLLGTVSNISDMTGVIASSDYKGHWKYFAEYHAALVKLNDPNWRQEGWNNHASPTGWLDTPSSYDENGNPVRYNEDSCKPSGSIGGTIPPGGPGLMH